MPNPGDSIDRFVVKEVVRAMSGASVCRVEHEVLGTSHRLVVLDPEWAAHSAARGRFVEAGRRLSKVRQRDLAAVTDVIDEAGAVALVVEHYDGQPSSDRLAAQGGCGRKEFFEIALPVLASLGALHEGGFVHGWIEPARLLLRPDAENGVRPLVLDACVGAVMREAAAAAGRAPDELSPAYRSPEQIQSDAEPTVASDVFAMGALLYELAVGRPAFAGATDFEVMQKVVRGAVSAPPSDFDQAHPGLRNVLRRALAPEPRHRYPDVKSLADDLAKVRDGLPVSLPAATRRGPSPGPAAPRRSSGGWASPGLVVGVVVAAILVITLVAGGAAFVVAVAVALVAMEESEVIAARPDDNDVATEIRELTSDKGHSEWDDEVEEILLANYDDDGSGTLDSRSEIGSVHCSVWWALEDGVQEGWEDSIRTIYGFDADYITRFMDGYIASP